MSDARRRAPTASMRMIGRDDFGEAEARHLLWRAGFGGTDAQIRTLASWGPERAVDHLLNVEGEDGYPRVGGEEFSGEVIREFTVAEQRAYRMALQQGDEAAVARFRVMRETMQRSDRDQMRGVQRWWLTRMIESPRPLEEKMTLFWHGHFASSYRTVENSYHMFLQNQLFRSHALGNFGELLFRIIRDPAMLKYLNNDRNFRSSPNENLARELMELFSLGEGQYEERDIREGARALTGYSYSGNEFVFNSNRHDPGPKRILGMSGELDGDDFVRAILERRACSDFIATKLYRWFVREIPERGTPERASVERVIGDLSGVLRKHRYELKPMLRMLFLSEHFYDSANRHIQIKSPVELIVGTIRSLHTPVRDLNTLLEAMELMGQRLFFPPNVAGWAGGRGWINTATVFVRQNASAFLLTGMTPGSAGEVWDGRRYDARMAIDDLLRRSPEAGRDPERIAGHLLGVMIGMEVDASRRAAVVRVLGSGEGASSSESLVKAMTLITALPEYQLC